MRSKILAALGGGLVALALSLPASAEPALWKLQGPHATVYLFGTVHVLKSTTQWRSPKIQAAFAAAGTLWEEVPDAEDTATAQALVMQYGVDPAHPLSSQLDTAGNAKLTAFETTYGLPDAGIEMLRPWLAAVTFSTLPVLKAGYDPKSGVDLVLKSMADAAHKPVLGFETLDQQMRFLADLPQQQQIDFLLATLDDANGATAQLGRMVDAWNAGDVAALDKLVNGDLNRYPALYNVLVVQRNRAFANKIEQMLQGNGVTFVAIGGGHLSGPDSVQADLAKDGIQAVRQ
jgi:uncharacterized protein YbaP (TraB family)